MCRPGRTAWHPTGGYHETPTVVRHPSLVRTGIFFQGHVDVGTGRH